MKHVLYVFLFGSMLVTVAHGVSHSMSCTYVNGERRCEESHSDTGNVAGAHSAASFGRGRPSTFQAAGTGSSHTGAFNVRQSASGEYANTNPPPDSGASGDSGSSNPSHGSDVFTPIDPEPTTPDFYPGFIYPGAQVGGGFGRHPFFGGGAFAGAGAFAGPGLFGRTGAYAGAGPGFFGPGSFAFAGRRRR